MNHFDRSGRITSKLPVVTVRKMTTTDIDSYCKLFQDVFSNDPWNEDWAISTISTNIKKLMLKKRFVGMVAETSSHNIGYVTGFQLSGLPSLFYMDQLFICVNYHGKGIGKNLLAETSGLLKTYGVSNIFLLTKPNTIADKFYRANGYKRFLPVIHINGKAILYKNMHINSNI